MKITAWITVDAADDAPVVISRNDLSTTYLRTVDLGVTSDVLHVSGTITERTGWLMALADQATVEAARLMTAEAVRLAAAIEVTA